MAVIAAHAARVVAAAVTPDGDEARRWAEEELRNPAYAEAQPTPFDLLALAVRDFFIGIFTSELPGGLGNAVVVIAAVVIVVLVVVAILVWGLPRGRGRSRLATGELFGDIEGRSAAELRREAAARAAAQEWDDAVVLRFRALARGLAERGVVETPPGATVHAFARRAGRAFPASADELDAAAAAFDDVRYLRLPGTRDLYLRVAAADDAVTAARPVTAQVPV